MRGRRRNRARTRPASGRFLWLLLAVGACQTVGAPPAPTSPPEGPTGPIVAPGPISEADETEAARIFREAQASFDARRFLEVLRLTSEIVDGYAAAGVSGPALLLSARAEREIGSFERADAAAERYASLLPGDDPRTVEARLFQAEALEGQPLIQLDRLLRIAPDATGPGVPAALDLVRTLVDSLSRPELEVVADAAPPGGAASSPLYARLAAELLARGEDSRARDLARRALDAGATGSEAAIAEGVLRGELPDGLRPERVFSIATVLSTGGPPALAEFSTSIAEGVEVAVATRLGDDFDVSIDARDDEADPALAAEIVKEIEAEGIPGVVGLLLDQSLIEAASARIEGVPIISPTARTAGMAGEATYSLSGGDRHAAESVALHSVSRAHQRVAMIYPDTPEAVEEAAAFEAQVTTFGVPIVGRFPYLEGATDFEAQLDAARDSLRAAEIAALGLTEDDTLFVEMLEPVGLFMPIPAEDVELVALQFAHNGLDTLAIEIMGTSGWTSPEAMEAVDARLLEGVVATAPVGGGPGSPGYARFQQAYEAYFQRSLVNNTPALGYDAASILLEALRPGRLRPEDVQSALRELVDFEGATGIYSVVDGRLVRRTEVVGIVRGALVPLPIG